MRGIKHPTEEARMAALGEQQRRYQRSDKALERRQARRHTKSAYDKQRYQESPDAAIERAVTWGTLNPSRARANHRRYELKQYGLTPGDFRDMEVGQAGRCLICLRVPTKILHVDHDHITGAVRGLLCGDCNKVLGLAADDPKRLRAAAVYLEGRA